MGDPLGVNSAGLAVGPHSWLELAKPPPSSSSMAGRRATMF